MRTQHKCFVLWWREEFLFLNFAALRRTRSVGRQNLCLRASDREAPGEGVKIPRLSKINPLSHGLTFTAAPERGSVRGGCPASASSSRCAGRGFPSAEEKSSIDGSRRSCGRVRRGPRGGQERGGKTLGFFRFAYAGCVFASWPCLRRNA